MKKSLMLTAVLVLVCFLTLFELPTNAAVQYDHLDIKVKVKSFQQTTLSWKKQAVDEYIIYQTIGNASKQKKIATISGKKTTYTVKTKKNKHYSIEIVGKKYKKGTKKLKHAYRGQAYFYSGVRPIMFFEYSWAEGKVSTKSIEIQIQYSEKGIQPDRIQIWRKQTGSDKYKLLKTKKLKDLKKGVFVDNTVKAHKTYKYKVRGVKKIGKKDCYGPYSDVMKKSAVNMFGDFTVSGDGDTDEVILTLTSNKDNGDLIIYPTWIMNYGYASEKDEKVCYKINGLSLDGESWLTGADNSSGIKIKAGEAFMLRFYKDDIPEFFEDDYLVGRTDIEVRYNGIPSFLAINPYGQVGFTYQNSEAIH